MNGEYQYTLEKGSKKHACPGCERRAFVRYIDKESDEYLPSQFGRCDRESNCGYSLDPYKSGYAKSIRDEAKLNNPNTWKPYVSMAPKKPIPKLVYFPVEVFNKTRKGYDQNVFIQNLLTNVNFPFEAEEVENVIVQYHLGTVLKGQKKGAITFPFIDKNNNVRAIQVKQFDKENHTTGTSFLHSIIEYHYSSSNIPFPQWLVDYNKNEKKVSCLFGEHLLNKYPNNPIALVEAPKTAIYGTLYFGPPENKGNFIWLAVYNLSSLNLLKCKSLKGRRVFLFPDLSKKGTAFQLWSKRARELELELPGTLFKVSDLLEKNASEEERIKGGDLADYLIKQDWRAFRKPTIKKPKPIYRFTTSYIESLSIVDGVILSERGYPANWDLFGEECNNSIKDFIRKAEQNPSLISLKNEFDLGIIEHRNS